MHRYKAYEAEFGEAAEIPCEVKSFRSERELLEAAIRPNCRHGDGLDTHDRLRAVELLKSAGVETEQIAQIIGVETAKVEGWIDSRYASVAGRMVPTKASTAHFGGGHRMTTKQEAVQRRLGGMKPLAWANMLIEMIDNGMIDETNENLLHGLHILAEKIQAKVLRPEVTAS